jgi:large subunit ribosomal protein L16
MPLMPSRVKYRRSQRGSWKGSPCAGTTLVFGEYGLKCLARGWVKAGHIEAARVVINRHMKRKGKLWIRVFPDKPVTKKPIETRMGKGKGDLAFWVAVVKPGVILFEVSGVSDRMAREALRLAAMKLGLPTKFVARRHAA